MCRHASAGIISSAAQFPSGLYKNVEVRSFAGQPKRAFALADRLISKRSRVALSPGELSSQGVARVMPAVERAPIARSRSRCDMQQPRCEAAIKDEILRTVVGRKHDPSKGMMNFESRSSTGSVVLESLERTSASG